MSRGHTGGLVYKRGIFSVKRDCCSQNKDMPYGHTTCGVALLNLSRQKKRAAHHKVREQQTRRFIPLHPY